MCNLLFCLQYAIKKTVSKIRAAAVNSPRVANELDKANNSL